MTYRLAPVCIVAIFVLCAAVRPPAAQQPPPTAANPARWFKGNTHTHTVNSDGDSTPEEVVRWYREHGYNFLVLTDHNYLTAVDGLNAVHGAADKFIVVRGEEVTSNASSKAVHVNGLNVDDAGEAVDVAVGRRRSPGERRRHPPRQRRFRTSTIRTSPGR